MTTLIRDAIFISHANPEDNEFTVWLGARLTAAGYAHGQNSRNCMIFRSNSPFAENRFPP